MTENCKILHVVTNELLALIENAITNSPNKEVHTLSSKDMAFFSKLISRLENEEIKLAYQNSAIYANKRGSNAPFLRLNANCSDCGYKNPNKVKYRIVIENELDKNKTETEIKVFKSNEHNHSNSKIQIRGEERKKVFEQIQIDAAGSCAQFELQQHSNEIENIPTQSVLRQIKSQEALKKITPKEIKFTTADYCDNLNLVKYAYNTSIDGGYIQDIGVNPFYMHLYLNESLECVHKTPKSERILFFDATGGLVNIPNKNNRASEITDNKRILNYFALFKGVNDFDKPDQSALIAELCSASHTTNKISSFFDMVKERYQNKYNSSLAFRLAVLDYSWASIHGLLKSLNTETVQDYAKRVFALAKGEIEVDSDKTWFASCAAHTMKRFINSLNKQLNKDVSNGLKTFAILCFSLLLQSMSLSEFAEYLEHIFVVFNTEAYDDNVVKSEKFLRESISKRQINDFDEQKIEKEYNQSMSNDKHEQYDNLEDEYSINSANINSVNTNSANNKKKTIKESTPFYDYFNRKINEFQLKYDTQAGDARINPFFCSEYFQLLNDKYLPYCFIWSSFTLQNLNADNNINRITNGIVEQYNGFRKSLSKKNLLPHIYAMQSLNTVRGQAKKYLKHLSTKAKMRKKKKADSSGTINEEEEYHKAEEHYNKRRNNAGFYQRSHDLLNVIRISNKSKLNKRINTSVIASKKLTKLAKKSLLEINRKKATKTTIPNLNKPADAPYEANLVEQTINFGYSAQYVANINNATSSVFAQQDSFSYAQPTVASSYSFLPYIEPGIAQSTMIESTEHVNNLGFVNDLVEGEDSSKVETDEPVYTELKPVQQKLKTARGAYAKAMLAEQSDDSDDDSPRFNYIEGIMNRAPLEENFRLYREYNNNENRNKEALEEIAKITDDDINNEVRKYWIANNMTKRARITKKDKDEARYRLEIRIRKKYRAQNSEDLRFLQDHMHLVHLVSNTNNNQN